MTRKHIFLSSLIAIIIAVNLTGCSSAKPDLQPINELTPDMTTKETALSRSGYYVNLYPEIDLSKITELPVYQQKKLSKDELRKKLDDFAELLQISEIEHEELDYYDWNSSLYYNYEDELYMLMANDSCVGVFFKDSIPDSLEVIK